MGGSVLEAWLVNRFGGSGLATAERVLRVVRIRAPQNEPRRGVAEPYFAERHRGRILTVDELPAYGGINIRAIAPGSPWNGVEASP
jgi:hypothetical protein